jgi:hypothetical protein
METEINKWYKTRKFIEDKVNKWKTETLPEGIESFKSFVKDIVNNSFISDEDKFKLLKGTITYFERYNLTETYHESYLDAKYNLNQISLKSDKIPSDDKEDAFYKWLKVCINSQNDPNIDFYFKKETKNLAKEEQVKKILFDNKGKLRDMFKENEWQIRLRKIRTWFLKRYDWVTAIKLHFSLTNTSKFECLDIIFLRFQCATLVGFIPLLFESKTWMLPLEFKWPEIGSISLILFLLALLYLSYDCSKVTGGDRGISTFGRALLVLFVFGVLPSLFYSFIFCGILSYQFIDFEKALYNDFYLRSLCSYLQWGFSPKIITFFAFIALSIGTLIQTIWEEKAVTEPL